jgi:O-methyltransferase
MMEDNILEEKKLVAWGAGNAFINFIGKFQFHFDYVIDDFCYNNRIGDYRVQHPNEILQKDESFYIFIFTYSSDIFQKIAKRLIKKGLLINEHFSDYSILIKNRFSEYMEQYGIVLQEEWYHLIISLFANLTIKNHSSVLGTWLIWGLLDKTRNLSGNAVELGVYEGGNAFYAAIFFNFSKDPRNYFLVDSFEGFGKISEFDPIRLQNQFRNNSVEEVRNRFAHFDKFKVIKGFIPDVLKKLDEDKYSFVYYDCDLYEPAKNTLYHFYPKLQDGGMFLIDDYCVSKDFLGVKKAVDEFCDEKSLSIIEIPETSHGLLLKSEHSER